MSAANMPKAGEKAPAFSLPALPDGKTVKLADFKGKKVVPNATSGEIPFGPSDVRRFSGTA